MAWDANLPAGNQPWNVGDDAIRANNAALDAAVTREHEPLSDATSGGVHKEGSARTHLWDGAELTTGTLNSNFNNPTNAQNSGKIVVDQPVGRVWYCYDGAAGSWLELSKLGGALTVTGLLTANNGVTIPTTKLLTGPAGESWLVNGAQTMNPLLHAARHALGGEDAITGILAGNVIYKTGAGPIVAAGTLVTHTFDFSGRSGDTLLVAVAWLRVREDAPGGAFNFELTAAIQLNDTDKSQLLDMEATIGSLAVNNAIFMPGAIACAFTVTNAAGQKVDWELKTVSGNTGQVTNFGMVLLDLGTVGLTT